MFQVVLRACLVGSVLVVVVKKKKKRGPSMSVVEGTMQISVSTSSMIHA